MNEAELRNLLSDDGNTPFDIHVAIRRAFDSAEGRSDPDAVLSTLRVIASAPIPRATTTDSRTYPLETARQHMKRFMVKQRALVVYIYASLLLKHLELTNGYRRLFDLYASARSLSETCAGDASAAAAAAAVERKNASSGTPLMTTMQRLGAEVAAATSDKKTSTSSEDQERLLDDMKTTLVERRLPADVEKKVFEQLSKRDGEQRQTVLDTTSYLANELIKARARADEAERRLLDERSQRALSNVARARAALAAPLQTTPTANLDDARNALLSSLNARPNVRTDVEKRWSKNATPSELVRIMREMGDVMRDLAIKCQDYRTLAQDIMPVVATWPDGLKIVAAGRSDNANGDRR